MKIEKYRMLLSAARNAMPEYQLSIYQRAFDSAEQNYGENSPEVVAVLLALTNHLKEKGNHVDAFACQERARSMFRAS